MPEKVGALAWRTPLRRRYGKYAVEASLHSRRSEGRRQVMCCGGDSDARPFTGCEKLFLSRWRERGAAGAGHGCGATSGPTQHSTSRSSGARAYHTPGARTRRFRPRCPARRRYGRSRRSRLRRRRPVRSRNSCKCRGSIRGEIRAWRSTTRSTRTCTAMQPDCSQFRCWRSARPDRRSSG